MNEQPVNISSSELNCCTRLVGEILLQIPQFLKKIEIR